MARESGRVMGFGLVWSDLYCGRSEPDSGFWALVVYWPNQGKPLSFFFLFVGLRVTRAEIYLGNQVLTSFGSKSGSPNWVV